jgi:hypothetical protein
MVLLLFSTSIISLLIFKYASRSSTAIVFGYYH